MKAKNNDNFSLVGILIAIAILLLIQWGMNNTEIALFLIEHSSDNFALCVRETGG